MKYINRLLLEEIKKWIDRREIIAIRGPRQSGKTTLLILLREWLEKEKGIDEKHIVYITFEDRGQLDAFSQNPKDFIARYLSDTKRHYFLIDEAQYCSELGQKLKLVYDLFENVKLIITGSSSLELKNQTGRFLVGRLLEFELMPLNFYEYLTYADESLARIYKQWNDKIIGMIAKGNDFEVKKSKEIFVDELLKHLNAYMLFGGYPAVVTAKREEEKKMLLKNLINNYIDRDIVSFLHITDTIKFRKFVTSIAALNGSMVKLNELANQIGSYFKEITMLMDVLEQTYIIRRISPYYKNLVTELKKAQKIYFVDTGLRNSLIDSFSDIWSRPDAGTLAENFVMNELYTVAKLNFWRTTAKTEVDFVANTKRLLPIEVKFAHFIKPEMGKSLYGFIEQYKPYNGIVVTKDFWGERDAKGTKVKFIPITYF